MQDINKEIQLKYQILRNSSNLYKLYKEFVVSEIINSEKFWLYLIDKPLSQQEFQMKQDFAISQSFSSRFKPIADSYGRLTMNLSVDDKNSILKVYPNVQDKYVEHRKSNALDEELFWSNFIQAYYFNFHIVSLESSKFYKKFKKISYERLKLNKNNFKYDLNSLKDNDYYLSEDQINGGYGLIDYKFKTESKEFNSNLIRHQNFVSMRILDIMKSSNFKICANTDDELTDLHEQLSSYEFNVIPLHITKIDLYMNTPSGLINKNVDLNALNYDFINCKKKQLQIKYWDYSDKFSKNNVYGLNSKLALSIANELSMATILASDSINSNDEYFINEVPISIKKEIKYIYVIFLELLKQFYKCFPPLNDFLIEKLKFIKDLLEVFYYKRLVVMIKKVEKLKIELNLCAHLENMLKCALIHYNRQMYKLNAIFK